MRIIRVDDKLMMQESLHFFGQCICIANHANAPWRGSYTPVLRIQTDLDCSTPNKSTYSKVYTQNAYIGMHTLEYIQYRIDIGRNLLYGSSMKKGKVRKEKRSYEVPEAVASR